MRGFLRRREKVVGEVDLGGDELGSRDVLGDFPEKRRNGDDSNPRMVGFRISLFLNAVQGLCLFGMIALMQMIFPLQRTVPFVVEVGDINERTISTKILKPGNDGERVLSEWEAGRYVKYRLEVLPVADEMKRRWAKSCTEANDRQYVDDVCGFVYLRSTEGVYERFLGSNTDINELIKQRISRVVSFDSEGIFKGYRRTARGLETQWEYRVTVIEYGQPKGTPISDCSEDAKAAVRTEAVKQNPCFELDRSQEIIQMWTVFTETEGEFKNRFLNPMGFQVTEWVSTPVRKAGA